MVNSGSSANLLLIQSFLNLGLLKKGDKIAVSAVTWGTNIMPLIQLGLIPVLVDCELLTLNVSTHTLSQINLSEIKGFFLTNVLGFSSDIEKIRILCDAWDILLFEDNCESLGSVVNNKLLGNFGFASTFSFYVGHHLSTIEGGMVCTDDKILYEMLIKTRSHGWCREVGIIKEDFYNKFRFEDLAFNFRPTEIQGFLGQAQLKYWDRIVRKRESNFKSFFKAINNKYIYPLRLNMDIISNFAFPLVFKSKKIFLRYKKIFKDVEIRPIVSGNMSRQPFLNKYFKTRNCPNAEIIHNQGFYFGNNPEITKEEIKIICNLLKYG